MLHFKFVLSLNDLYFPFKRWTFIPPMLEERCYFGIALTPNLHLFAVGGCDDANDDLKTVEMLKFRGGPDYEPSKNWVPVAPLLEPRSEHAVAYFKGYLIVAGSSPSVEIFNLPCEVFPCGQWTRVEVNGLEVDDFPSIYTLIPCGNQLIGTGTLKSYFTPTMPHFYFNSDSSKYVAFILSPTHHVKQAINSQ